MNKLVFALVFISSIQILSAQNEPKLGKNSLQEVVAAMTLEEKAHLVVGMGMKIPGMPELSSGPVVGQTNDKVVGAAGTTFAIPRLGIPSIVVADGPAGLRISPKRDGDNNTFYCTAFPVATLLASSWDTELVKKAGEAIGNETKSYGVDILLGPAMNIHRNSLGGRNFEYYSEDPLVAGKMASAMIMGIQKNGVGTSLKHFAANNQETNRNLVNTVASERTLREIYLRGFEYAIKESKPWTIMSSYNKINGVYASESADLLTTILRKDWKYNGFVMTDWFGGKDAVAQMKAGNELLMPGTPKQYDEIIAALKDGSLDVKVVDNNVMNILKIITETPTFKGFVATNKPDLKKNAKVSRDLATEGMILLKNNKSTLPLKASAEVAAFGITSFDFISGGTGSGDVNEAYTISLEQGLKNAGFKLNNELKTVYENYIKAERLKNPKPQSIFSPIIPLQEMAVNEDLLKNADKASVAIITIGRSAGEFADRKANYDFYLTENETNMLKTVATHFHKKGKKVVVILNIGGQIDVTSWSEYADALLLAYLPGQEAGNAVADILSGKVNPCGKLTSSFAARYEDEPSSKYFPGVDIDNEMVYGPHNIPLGKKSEVTYQEGIYVGYRYYQTFGVKPAYEFGYGLSYTNFAYSNLKINKTTLEDKLVATVTITNKGKKAGKEVVQLYVSAPNAKLAKPASELKGFAKTKLLQVGESQTLTFTISATDVASFDTANSSWLLEAGKYELKIGASSSDIRQKTNFTVKNDIITGKVNKALPLQKEISEMSK